MTADVQPLLWVPDFDRARAFYRDALGFTVLFEGANPKTGDTGTAALQYRGAVIILSALDLFAPAGGTPPASVLYFHVDEDLDALFARWKDAPGGRVIAPPADQWWGDRIFILADPFGHRLVVSRPVGSSGS